MDEANSIGIHEVKICDLENNETKSQSVSKISCGAVFSMALTIEGDVYVWGSNNNGQMGGCVPYNQYNTYEDSCDSN